MEEILIMQWVTMSMRREVSRNGASTFTAHVKAIIRQYFTLFKNSSVIDKYINRCMVAFYSFSKPPDLGK